MGIIDTIRLKWREGSILLRLIFINIAVFITLHVIALVLMFAGQQTNNFLHWIEMPSVVDILATRPWSIITYMFAQFDLLHLVFNMLWLYWFGSIFLISDTPKRMLALYIYGGLGGAMTFMAAYNAMPLFDNTTGWLIGSSASVIAIVVATAMLHPDYRINLLFIGSVSLKWIAIVTIGIDLISIHDTNAGGHIAHIGGAIVGAIYALSLKRGNDITRPFNSLIDKAVVIWGKLTTQKPKTAKTQRPKYDRHYTTKSEQPNPADDQADLDAILDKIKKSGYAALSQDEKRKLFDVSKRIK